MHTKNARISKTMLGYEDHGIFTFSIELNYGGSFQGAGQYCLYQPTTGSDYAGKMISQILEVVGVDTWEQLPGKSVVALLDGDQWNAQVIGLQNFLGGSQVIFANVFKDKELTEE